MRVLAAQRVESPQFPGNTSISAAQESRLQAKHTDADVLSNGTGSIILEIHTRILKKKKPYAILAHSLPYIYTVYIVYYMAILITQCEFYAFLQEMHLKLNNLMIYQRPQPNANYDL